MKLATWNINSIRAREARLLTWLDREKPDVLCLQETKVEDAGFKLDSVPDAAAGADTIAGAEAVVTGSVSCGSTFPRRKRRGAAHD